MMPKLLHRLIPAFVVLLVSCGDDGATPSDPCAQCSADATCSAATGTCSCPAGFAGDGTISGTGCSNVNECAAAVNPCSQHATCQDSEGAFTCTCVSGYLGDGRATGTGCADVDECAAAENPCGSVAVCANSEGSYQCRGLFAPSPFANRVLRLDPTTFEVLETLSPTFDAEMVGGATSFTEHPVTGALLAVVKVGSGRKLATFDAEAQTYSNGVALTDRFSSIAFDGGGQLFGVTGDGATNRETLYRLDPTTGDATLVRALGTGADGEVIQWNPDDGKLYHWSGGTSSFEAITMAEPYEVTPLSSSFTREVFGARWDAAAHDFLVFDISSAVRRFATDGSFGAQDIATFPEDLRSPATAVALAHALDPVTGPVAGGTAVTLIGSGFTVLGDTVTVNFGGTPVVGTVVDDHHLTVTSPLTMTAGPVTVSITVGDIRFGWYRAFTYTSTLQ
ncbi:MAG: EGF domain-containing protein [Kofleriaceae bacterium]